MRPLALLLLLLLAASARAEIVEGFEIEVEAPHGRSTIVASALAGERLVVATRAGELLSVALPAAEIETRLDREVVQLIDNDAESVVALTREGEVLRVDGESLAAERVGTLEGGEPVWAALREPGEPESVVALCRHLVANDGDVRIPHFAICRLDEPPLPLPDGNYRGVSATLADGLLWLGTDDNYFGGELLQIDLDGGLVRVPSADCLSGAANWVPSEAALSYSCGRVLGFAPAGSGVVAYGGVRGGSDERSGWALALSADRIDPLPLPTEATRGDIEFVAERLALSADRIWRTDTTFAEWEELGRWRTADDSRSTNAIVGVHRTAEDEWWVASWRDGLIRLRPGEPLEHHAFPDRIPDGRAPQLLDRDPVVVLDHDAERPQVLRAWRRDGTGWSFDEHRLPEGRCRAGAYGATESEALVTLGRCMGPEAELPAGEAVVSWDLDEGRLGGVHELPEAAALLTGPDGRGWVQRERELLALTEEGWAAREISFPEGDALPELVPLGRIGEAGYAVDRDRGELWLLELEAVTPLPVHCPGDTPAKLVTGAAIDARTLALVADCGLLLYDIETAGVDRVTLLDAKVVEEAGFLARDGSGRYWLTATDRGFFRGLGLWLVAGEGEVVDLRGRVGLGHRFLGRAVADPHDPDAVFLAAENGVVRVTARRLGQAP